MKTIRKVFISIVSACVIGMATIALASAATTVYELKAKVTGGTIISIAAYNGTGTTRWSHSFAHTLDDYSDVNRSYVDTLSWSCTDTQYIAKGQLVKQNTSYTTIKLGSHEFKHVR